MGIECIGAMGIFDGLHVEWLTVSVKILLNEESVSFLCEEVCAATVDVGKLCVPLAALVSVDVV